MTEYKNQAILKIYDYDRRGNQTKEFIKGLLQKIFLLMLQICGVSGGIATLGTVSAIKGDSFSEGIKKFIELIREKQNEK